MRRKRLWIPGVILFAAGLAVYLLTWLPASAVLNYLTQTTVADFNVGTFYHTGLARKEDGEVTLLAIGVAGTWTRTNPSGLPPVWGHAMVEHNGYVYVLGGCTDYIAGTRILTTSVFFARINTDTHTLEPFARTTPLPSSAYPNGVYMHAATVVGDYLYVFGGVPPAQDVPFNTVLFAPFNADGTLGAWQTTTSMPGLHARGPAVTLNGYIYLPGGQDAGGQHATDAVWYAHPDPATGQITEWLTATGRLPYPPYGLMVATYEGRIYVLGGLNTDDGNVYPDVYFARPLEATGDITQDGWIPVQAPLPNNIMGGIALAFNGELVTFGGLRNFPGTPSGLAYAALLDINSGDVITYTEGEAWYQSEALRPDRLWHTGILGPDQHIYILGGTSGDLKPLTNEMLNIGATTGVGGQGYAPTGWYIGPPFELGRERKILNFQWSAEWLTDTEIALQYRTQMREGGWSNWSAPMSPPGAPPKVVTMSIDFPDLIAQRFQYRVLMTTTNPVSYTPALRGARLEYDVPLPPQFRKEANPPSLSAVRPGDRITYTLIFTNPNNLSSLREVELVDTLPISAEYVSGSIWSTLGTPDDSNPAELRWTIGTLPPQTGGRAGFVARVKPGATGTLMNHGRFASYDTGYLDAFTYHFVMDVLPTLTKQADPPSGSNVAPGGLITFTIEFSNEDPNITLTNVTISDTLPSGTRLLPGSCSPACVVSGRTLSWPIGSLTPGQTELVRFIMQVSGMAQDGALVQNVAGLYSDQAIILSEPTSHRVAVPYDLAIVKSDGIRKAQEGQVLTYTIVYTNNVYSGIVTLTNVIITEDLLSPACMEFLATPGWNVVSPTRAVYTVGTLPPNEGGSLQVSVRIKSPLPPDEVLSARNQVSIGDDGQNGHEANPLNNVFVDSNVIRGPDLIVRNVQLPPRFSLNSLTHVNLEIVNEGVSPASSWEGDKGPWLAVELYARPQGWGPPTSPHDHAYGWWCAVTAPSCPADKIRNLGIFYTAVPGSVILGVDQSGAVSIPAVFTQTGVYSLYLQADVGFTFLNDPAYGRVQEADDYNNVIFLGAFSVELFSSRVYLPIVLKQYSP